MPLFEEKRGIPFFGILKMFTPVFQTLLFFSKTNYLARRFVFLKKENHDNSTQQPTPWRYFRNDA
jgi:hypothetical protein